MSKIYAAVLAAGLLYAGPSLAASGPQFSGPIGATDLGNAYLPGKAGVYIGLTEFFAYANRIYDNNYNPHPGAANGNDVAAYLLYVYPFHAFGGTLASGIDVAYQTNTAVTVPNLGLPYQTAVGWRDLYVDFLQWSRYIGPLFGENVPRSADNQGIPYGLTVKLQYSMLFPTGNYDPYVITSVGGGTYFFIPNAAITYLSPPDAIGGGVELDLHVFYDTQTTNPEFDNLTNYKSGDVIDLDYAVGQRLGAWTVGLAGSYAFQLNGDQVQVNNIRQSVDRKGNHLESLSLGPIATYYSKSLHTNFKLKVPFSLQARNSLGLTGVIFNAFFGF